MPLLKGGIKHRKGIGTRGTNVDKITRKRFLGRGFEGRVDEVELKLNSKKNTRTISMAEKRFYPWPFHQIINLVFDSQVFTMPRKQFKIIEELIEINKRKKLRLRIPTIRLRTRFLRKATIIMTKLNIVQEAELTPQQKKEFEEDKNRQKATLEDEGFIGWNLFYPVIVPKTNECKAYIVDLGHLRKGKGMRT